MFPDLGAFVDAALEEVPRPEDEKKRKDFYSGKKKMHAVKTQTAQQERADSPYKQERWGKKTRLHMFKEQHPPVPQEIDNYFDLRY